MPSPRPSSPAREIVVLPDDVDLDEREEAAYRYWCSTDAPPVAPSTQAQFYELFLAGKSCEEIRRLNPGFSLGAIVAARISGRWDRERERYLQDLLVRARQRMQQAALESVEMLADLLTAKNKLYRDNILRFIQTGDDQYLQCCGKIDLKGYKEIAEAMMKITGQDQQKKVTVAGTLNVATPQAATPISGADAALLLAALRDQKKALPAPR